MRLITILLLAMILGACVPLGSDLKKTSVSGKTQDITIERREIEKPFIAVVSPDGFFQRGSNRQIQYWLLNGESRKKLSHLSELNPDLTLKEILNINNSNQWAAFTIDKITKEHVQVNIIVLDKNTIKHIQVIEGCARVDVCAEHFLSLKSYSIEPIHNNSLLQISTLSGMVTYDLMTGSRK
ncbi:MAG: hypothetical protein A2X80_04875 [Geobacteraceae bacterium GWB2_52_12]|nr:MAG: hypothetical protein A2X80_04875 [Geobacteraceae bacterium GWB2_52_12]